MTGRARFSRLFFRFFENKFYLQFKFSLVLDGNNLRCPDFLTIMQGRKIALDSEGITHRGKILEIKVIFALPRLNLCAGKTCIKNANSVEIGENWHANCFNFLIDNRLQINKGKTNVPVLGIGGTLSIP